MPEPFLQPVPMLDLTLPAMLPRSRLYSLKPIGVGTPLVESLTGYLTRLAYAHRVTVDTLAAVEIAPLVNRSANAARVKFSLASYSLNGLESWTTWTLTALTTLTQQSDLNFLTMQPWGQVLARPNLLRQHLAWCPACFSQWQQTGQPLYIPLLWMLKPAALCPQHRQPLRDRCPYPDCGHLLRPINSRIKLGYCPSCRRWLGLTAEPTGENNVPPSNIEGEEQHWLADQLARLLAATPTLAATTDQALVARNFKRCLAASVPSTVQGLVQALGLSRNSFSRWLHGGHPLQLGLLLQVCHHLGVSVLDMLTAQPGQLNDPLPPEASDPPPARITTETGKLRRRLGELLDDPRTSPGSAEQVARQLGVTPAIIKFHCPEQYQQILQRNAQGQQARRQARNQKLAAELRAVLDTDEIPPPSSFEVARRLHINPRTAKANCPDLCRVISHKRKAFYEARDAQVEASLRQILATAEAPPPTISQVATRLNEPIAYLYRKFPVLCQAVTQRHREYQPAPARECLPQTTISKPKRKNLVDRRSQFITLLTAGETPPLALAEVSRQLGCSITLLRIKYPDLCRQLRQQQDAYRQQRRSKVEAELRHLLAAAEAPLPPIREIVRQLELDVTALKRWQPELYAEIVRRHQADRQGERQRRQNYLDQIVSENPVHSPSLSQVAGRLGCEPSALQRQFPQQSQIIVDRYRGYRDQEYATARAALEAALSETQQPPLLPLQVAHQLGYENKRYLQAHFPDLCHQLFQRYETQRRQVARTRLTVLLAEPVAPPPSLAAVSRQLGYHLNSLKYLCPDLCQIIEQRYQAHRQQTKQAAKEALEAILSGTQTPASVAAVARQVGYSLTMIQRDFPELTRAVSARYKEFARQRGEQRRHQLDQAVKQITRNLFEAGIDPGLRRVILRLPSPAAARAPHVRQAWQAARQELGLPT